MQSPLQMLRARNAAAGKPAQVTPGQKGGLAAIVGVVAAGILYTVVPREEGTVYVGYLDVVGIPTKCMGDTTNVRVGRRYTDAECRASLDRQLVAHAAPVMACTPGISGNGHDNQRAAAISLAYNIGTSAYCRSTVRTRFNARDYRGACDAFMAWTYAGGRQIRGLVLRRGRERVLCLKDVK